MTSLGKSVEFDLFERFFLEKDFKFGFLSMRPLMKTLHKGTNKVGFFVVMGTNRYSTVEYRPGSTNLDTRRGGFDDTRQFQV